ncbi:MAG TPA: DNA polymerase III subunit delta' [Ktedonobacterales bacterium]|nr:DNA polymerase III subunit delta' [Ktedonobacterales bacterium]
MRLREFIGNERVIGWLQHTIATDQVRHAYLFTGLEQIGKRTLALAFAQSIQCQDRARGEGDACGACVACRKIEHGNHPDVQLLALPKDKQSYSIDQIRALIDQVALKPTEGRKRIFIIPDADLLTLPAIQASLKVLEEPPPNGMILLTCANAESLLPTVLSRCQEVALTPVAPDILAPALEQRFEIGAPQALETALLSGGRPGWAIEALSEPEVLAERRQLLRDLAALTRASRSERISAAKKYIADNEHAKEHTRHIIELWLPWWRDVLLAARGAGDIIRHADDRTAVEAQARAWGPEAAERFVRAQLKALEQLDQNANPRLVFEVMLQSLPL